MDSERKRSPLSLICGRYIQRINVYTNINTIMYAYIYREHVFDNGAVLGYYGGEGEENRMVERIILKYIKSV